MYTYITFYVLPVPVHHAGYSFSSGYIFYLFLIFLLSSNNNNKVLTPTPPPATFSFWQHGIDRIQLSTFVETDRTPNPTTWLTLRNIFGIILNQTEIRLYLPFSDWFGKKQTSVWFNDKFEIFRRTPLFVFCLIAPYSSYTRNWTWWLDQVCDQEYEFRVSNPKHSPTLINFTSGSYTCWLTPSNRLLRLQYTVQLLVELSAATIKGLKVGLYWDLSSRDWVSKASRKANCK